LVALLKNTVSTIDTPGINNQASLLGAIKRNPGYTAFHPHYLLMDYLDVFNNNDV